MTEAAIPQAGSSSRHAARIRLLSVLILAGLLLVLAVRDIDWERFLATLLAARLELLTLATVMAVGSFVLRGLRWWVLLNQSRGVGIVPVCRAAAVGYLANSYLPARSGDLIRCVVEGFTGNVGKTFALATTAVERLLDVAALALIGAATLSILPNVPDWMQNTALLVGAATMAGIAGLAVLCRLERNVISSVDSWPFLGTWKTRTLDGITQIFQGLRSFQHYGRATAFVLLTLSIWLVDGLSSVVGAEALGLQLTLPQALVLLSALGLASALPSTPGFVGIYQYVAVTVLVPFGYAQAEALAYIFVSQALYYVTVTILGGIGLWQLAKSGCFPGPWSGLGASQDTEAVRPS